MAQPKGKVIVSAADAAEASRLFQDGRAQGSRGEFELAAVSFEAAFRKGKNPKALYNQATAIWKAGHPARAIAEMYKFLDLADSADLEAGVKAQAEKDLAELKGLVCTYVISGPPGTTATINGQPMRRESGYAEPGNVVVEITAGPMKRKRESTCKAGEQKVAWFDDVPATPGAGAAGAVVVAEPGFGTVKPPEGPVVPPKVEPTTSRSGGLLIAAIGTGVVGAGGLVLGGVFGSQSSSAAEERRTALKSSPTPCVNQASATCNSTRELAEKASSRRTLSVVSFIAGGAMLGASAVFAILYAGSSKETEAKKTAKGPQVRVAPMTDGIVVFGQF